MATWIKIDTSSNHKLVPHGTIGELLSSTTNYYLIQHWALNKTIQELKSNCSILESLIGGTYTYSNNRFPCTSFKVTAYAEDYPSGEKTFSQFTGKRVVLVPVNKTTAATNLVEQQLIVNVSELDNC